MESGQLPKITPQGAQANFRKAIDAGERGAILVHRDMLRIATWQPFLFISRFLGLLQVGLLFPFLLPEVGARAVGTTGWYSSSLTPVLPDRKGECRAARRILPLIITFVRNYPSGILKIMSKMGISLLSSYQGAQIFEAVGIGEALLNLGFKGTPSRLGGLETNDLACETASFMVRFLLLSSSE